MNSTPVNLKRIDKFNWVVPAHDREIEKQLEHYGSLDIECFEQRIPELHGLLNGKTVVDIGAYTGDTALTFIKQGARCVYAFEAYLDAYCALCINCQGLNVEMYHEIMGDGRKVSLLTGTDVYPGMRYVQEGGSVHTAKLDDAELPPFQFLKIDVEGFEIAVLNGALATIKEYRPVILIEAFPECLKRYGNTVQDIHTTLEPLRYQLKPIGEENSVRWDYLATPL